MPLIIDCLSNEIDAVIVISSSVSAFALSAACLIESPRHAERAMTNAISPIRMFLPFDRLIHFNAFFKMYITVPFPSFI